MMNRINKESIKEIPTTKELERELNKIKYQNKFLKIFKSTMCVLIVVIALSILVATLVFPVLEIYGKSMNPNLIEGDIALCVKKNKFNQGDIIAFYYNNKILVKRVIAKASDWIDVKENGDIFINNELLDEPYLKEKSLGESDIVFPYQVPEDSYFVLGDERDTSIDSRNSLIGSIHKDDIIGKIVFKVWPLKRIGFIKD